jgi:hypothetical protein
MRRRPTAALVAASLAALLAIPAGAGTVFGGSGYYAVLEFRVTGNSELFDNFEDASKTTPPTSYFTPLGGSVFSEAYSPGGIGRPDFEGQLALTAGDGAADEGYFGPVSDLVFDGIPLVNGEGNAVVDATFLVAFPSPGSSELYGLGIGESDTYIPTNAMYVITTGDDVSQLPTPCDVPNAAVLVFASAAFEFGCDVIDLQALSGALVLRLVVDDMANTALPAYSIDGGNMFIGGASWDVPAVAGAVWTYSFHIYPAVFAAYDVPEPRSAGELAALAGVALFARSRRARR